MELERQRKRPWHWLAAWTKVIIISHGFAFVPIAKIK